MNNKEILEKDNCQSVSSDGKEVCIKVVRLRTETFYKADAMGEGAVHSESRSSVVEVKNELVQRKFMQLPGEISIASGAGFNLPQKRSGTFSNGCIDYREVSRGHSSPEKRAGSSCHTIVCSEESGGLSQDEGPNLRCGCRSISSLINQTAVSEGNGAPQDRVIMLQHDCS